MARQNHRDLTGFSRGQGFGTPTPIGPTNGQIILCRVVLVPESVDDQVVMSPVRTYTNLGRIVVPPGQWSADSLPTVGQLAPVFYEDGGDAWVTFFKGQGVAPRTPVGPAGGALTGEYPNPTLVQPTWVALPYAAGYGDWGAPYALAEYCKDALGFVTIRGAAKNGSTFSFGSSVWATLPVGYRPAAEQTYPCSYADASSVFGSALVSVNADGTIFVKAGVPTGGSFGAALSFLDLSPVRFHV